MYRPSASVEGGHERLLRAQAQYTMAEFRHIVRIANTDLAGEKQVRRALLKIKGIGESLAEAICKVAKIDPAIKMGELDAKNDEILTRIILEPDANGIPVWMLNRQRDPETGADHHLIGGDIKFTIENDIKTQRRIKSYKGVRHAAGLPVRGQRTQGNFRKQKGKAAVKKKKTTIRK